MSRYEELKNELFESIKTRKEGSIRSLQEFTAKLQLEVNQRVDALYERRELILKARSKDTKNEHRRYFKSFWKVIAHPNIKYLISAPFIYGMIIPAVMLDIFLEIYHRICFPLYGIPLVKRSEYFTLDRRFLAYLNWFEKLNCLYCSYFNNLVSYTREIAGRTEKYWCPIKHSMRMPSPHPYYEEFADYLDAEDFRKKYANIKCFTTEGKEET